MKMIKVSIENHKELREIGYDYHLKTYDDIVSFLIKNLRAHEFIKELVGE